jgi:PAS domain S-box-containing protein
MKKDKGIKERGSELDKGEERFRKVFTYSNDAIFVIDPEEDKIIDVNPKATQMLGYSKEELLSLPITAIHPNEMPLLLEFAKNVFEKGNGWTNELTCLTKSGNFLPAEISASVIEISGKSFMIALVRDISKLEKIEKALRESENRLSRILESAMDAIVTVDTKTEVKLFNEAAESVFQVPVSEAIGQSFDRFLSEEFRKLLNGYIQSSSKRSMAKKFMWVPEGFTALRSDKKEFPIEATVSLVEVAGEKLFTIILRDINERKKAEEELSKLQLEKVYLLDEIKTGFGEIVGNSSAIKKVFQNIERVASTDVTVLLTGETGTGKELFARALHKLSKRKEKVIVKVNCAAIPSGLIESEFFGHEKGAFTGAIARKIGRFELAHEGTIFLDEIGDLPLELQAKLLRVLQEGEFERVGGSETHLVNVRVIAATNRDLEKALEEGKFRQDLFYRLNVFPIQIPSLRERKGDISLLVKYFVMKYGKKMNKNIETVPKNIMGALEAYHWPGNVRELENIIERTVLITLGSQLDLGEWLPKPAMTPKGTKISTLEELEKDHIEEILDLTGGRVSGEQGAAKILGLKPTTLEARMKKLGIEKRG